MAPDHSMAFQGIRLIVLSSPDRVLGSGGWETIALLPVGWSLQMPLCYFHIQDGEYLSDREGTQLPNIATAQIEAVRLTGQLLSEGAEKFWIGDAWMLRVTDDTDLTLFELTFSASCSAAMGTKSGSL